MMPDTQIVPLCPIDTCRVPIHVCRCSIEKMLAAQAEQYEREIAKADAQLETLQKISDAYWRERQATMRLHPPGTEDVEVEPDLFPYDEDDVEGEECAP